MAKLTPDLAREVTKKATEGLSTREISAWLKKAHGITIGHQAIAKRVREVRVERAEVAKVIVRETLGKSIPADLERLERLAAKAEQLANMHEHEPETWVKLSDQVRKITDTKLHFSGADTPDDSVQEMNATAQRLREKMAREAAEEV